MTRIFFKIQEDMTNPRQEILPLGILTIDENEDIVSWDLLLETLEKLKNIPILAEIVSSLLHVFEAMKQDCAERNESFLGYLRNSYLGHVSSIYISGVEIEGDERKPSHHPWCSAFTKPVEGCPACTELWEKYP